MSADDLTLRPATGPDLPAIAEVYLASRDAAYPAVPRGVHPPEQVRAWVAGWDLTAWEVWLAEARGEVLGFAALEQDWLHSLYVRPGAWGQGIGTALLDLVRARRPDGFCLWVFETNTAARAFYARHGLVALERTDGTGNEERSPDLRMAWPGERPLDFYRRLIDEVDAQLGDLLARRFALTRAVQRHKATGPRPVARDPHREAQIVAAMAERAPELGPQRLARIVHTIITESLDDGG